MRKTQNVMDSKMQQAHDWLQDPQALHGGVGEKSVRQVNENLMKKDILFDFKFIFDFKLQQIIIYSSDSGASTKSCRSIIAY